MKIGRMWTLETAVGSCGSARVHSVADCWTFPEAVPTQIMGADGLMLVHGELLSRYTPLDTISTMEVSRSGSGGTKVGYG